ncbi:MAG TPA: PilZ domain-containing protein [Sandaracinaceae bacterium LLY-WYZ-13_1]|nr:PilZ domain-containing protein [Sandaracinaceae bacterium LLY-WYZ-13_1]
MTDDRRTTPRRAVSLTVRQVVDEVSYPSRATDLSPTGVFLERGLSAFARASDAVQIAIPLPGTDEELWVRGEVVYDCLLPGGHGTAVRFTAMADRHAATLERWLTEP